VPILSQQKMKLTLLFFVLFLTANCDNNSSSQPVTSAPLELSDGLKVGELTEVGLDQDLLRKAVSRIERGKYGEVHSMLIYKNEMLVFEEYFQGHQYQWDAPGHKADLVSWDREMQHCIHSDTKSITSLCIGIAIDKGFINSVNQSIFDYLPDHQYLNNNNREFVTIEHLLTMTSGFRWEEWGVSLASVENDQIGIWFWEDGPMDYVLSRDLVAVPGTHFNYSGGDIQILVEILKNATGMNVDEFSGKYLFEPLGITNYDWWLVFPSGEIQGAGGLKLIPRDMLKIGVMMLNKGLWEGKRIISESWVSKCRTAYLESNIKVPGEDAGKVGYGYTWWTKEIKFRREKISIYFALGWGGQKIIVLPDVDMVVVFTGANYNTKVHEFHILEKYILSAVI